LTGITHTYEIPYVFGFPNVINNPDVRTDTGMLRDAIAWNENDVIFSDYVMILWTNFAKYGFVFCVRTSMIVME